MLIFTRKKNEAFVIDNNIIVKILENNGKYVKVGIEAPREIDVHREEIQQKINLELNGK